MFEIPDISIYYSCNITASHCNEVWVLEIILLAPGKDVYVRSSHPEVFLDVYVRNRHPEVFLDVYVRSSHPEVFLGKGVLKICNRFTGEHPCRSAILIKLQSNFVEIALQHGCSPVNLLHIFRTPFPKNTSGWRKISISYQGMLHKFGQLKYFSTT